MSVDLDNTSDADMDKVYRKYKEMKQNPQKLMDELGLDLNSDGTMTGGDQAAAAGTIRKETDLNNEEKQFLLSVERGDMPTCRHFLEEAQIYFNININCVDPLGRTALLIAIENENIEMLELLLSYNVEVGDALLHAINEENVEAVEMLLIHQQTNKKDLSAKSKRVFPFAKQKDTDKMKQVLQIWKKKPMTALATGRSSGSTGSGIGSIQEETPLQSTPTAPSLLSAFKSQPSPADTEQGFLGGVPSSSFTPDITPIILAAHRDNYEIIKILLDRGDRIPKPHDVRCNCTECVTKSNEDSLNHSRSRINAYRALSSPSLISLSSKDPILTAFELSWELKRLSRLENEFKRDYEELAKQCQDFSTDLLDQTRGSRELEMILNYDADGGVGEDEDKMHLARLKLAIKYKQKKFVSHPNCQQLLASLWYEGLPGFRRRHIIFKVLLTVSVCLLYPIMSIFYIIAPRSSVGLFMRRPFIKFICHSASYMTFLFLLILASQRIESIINLGGGSSDQTAKMNREVRGAPPTSIEWMILAYVFGLIWSEIKQLWSEGSKQYVQDMWNILDFITNSLYISTFTLKLVAYLRVEEEKRLGDKNAEAERQYWDAYDPNLIAEGLFAAANVFSSLKLIYIFTVNPHLGPLQISLGRMVMDIMKFCCIAILVVFSYACGVNQLYWYYAEERQKDCDRCTEQLQPNEDPNVCDCDRTLSNLFEILQTLYFAMYGLVDIRHFELKEKHEFTQFVGKLMFGTYSGIMIIVLINMLIAMLSTSFQLISNDADTEWKYARSKLWMSFFEVGGTVPPPFNMIPTPKTVWYLLLWIKEKLCRCSKKAKRSKWQSIRKVVKKVNERDMKYQAVMRNLIKRYIMKRTRANQTEGVTEDDLNEIKQDISSLRYELLEIFRSNGMKTPTNANASKSKNTGRLKRKGSRMSMERLGRQMQVEPAAEENPYSVPNFIQKSNSLGSTSSKGSLSKASLGGDLNNITEEDKRPVLEDGGIDITKETRSGANSPDKSTENSTTNNNCDEGLGESFDQQSEVSDSSLSINKSSSSFNGMDTVLEEAAVETVPTAVEMVPTAESCDPGDVVLGQEPEDQEELTLDPRKLQASGNDSVSNTTENCDIGETPFSKKMGSIKKVSFMWAGEDESSEEKKPVSDTYVYDGRKKKKFAAKRGK